MFRWMIIYFIVIVSVDVIVSLLWSYIDSGKVTVLLLALLLNLALIIFYFIIIIIFLIPIIIILIFIIFIIILIILLTPTINFPLIPHSQPTGNTNSHLIKHSPIINLLYINNLSQSTP